MMEAAFQAVPPHHSPTHSIQKAFALQVGIFTWEICPNWTRGICQPDALNGRFVVRRLTNLLHNNSHHFPHIVCLDLNIESSMSFEIWETGRSAKRKLSDRFTRSHVLICLPVHVCIALAHANSDLVIKGCFVCRLIKPPIICMHGLPYKRNTHFAFNNMNRPTYHLSIYIVSTNTKTFNRHLQFYDKTCIPSIFACCWIRPAPLPFCLDNHLGQRWRGGDYANLLAMNSPWPRLTAWLIFVWGGGDGHRWAGGGRGKRLGYFHPDQDPRWAPTDSKRSARATSLVSSK